MPDAARVSTRCLGAEKVLYLRFRGEPLLSRTLKSRWHVYELFRTLVEFASYGYPRLICVKRGGRVAAAAAYTVPERPRVVLSLKLLKLALLASRWGALVGFLRSIPSFLAYARVLQGLKPSGHLLFIASAIEGKGYGSLLLRILERACARSGCDWLVLEVYAENPAARFYFKRGYRPRLLIEWLGARYLLMAKPLALQRSSASEPIHP